MRRPFPYVTFNLIHKTRMSYLKPETPHPTRLATGWTGRGSNPSGGEISRTCPDRPWGPPSLLYNGYLVFPGGKERPGREADPSPLLVPWSRKSKAIPLFPLWAVQPVQSLSACTTVHFTFTSTPPMDRTACTEPQCLYNGALYPFFYFGC